MLPGLGNKPLIKRLGLADLSASVRNLINGALQKSGGDMLGLFRLFGDATDPLHPVTKQQLDSAVAPFLNLSGRNRIINGAFSINQRAFAGGALSPGSYGHDRWKAGSGGVTHTVSGETATITAGTLVQVIEGLNVPEGGTYTLSWLGTAQARVDGGSYAASPITVTGKTAAANTTIEFGTGTVSNAQYEAGSSATTFERRLYSQEFAACQRYYWVSEHAVTLRGFGAGGGAQTYQSIGFPVRMRSSPTISASFSGATNTSAAGIASQGAGGFSLYVTSSGASDYAVTYSAGNTATSEL